MLTRRICENYEIQQKLILSASIQWFWFSVIDKDKNCTLAILYKDKNKTRRVSSLLMLDMNQLFDLVNFFHTLTKSNANLTYIILLSIHLHLFLPLLQKFAILHSYFTYFTHRLLSYRKQKILSNSDWRTSLIFILD